MLSRNYNYMVVLAVVVALMLAMIGVVYGDFTVGLDSSSPIGGCNPFSENFNDGVADNWSTDGSDTWAVTFGVYRMTGSSPTINIARCKSSQWLL